MDSFATLKIDQPEPHLVLVTLNRPEVSNAFNTQMGRDFLALWTKLTEDPGEARCVVLTGAGAKAFCGGADLKERQGMQRADWQKQHELFERHYWALADLPLPIVAAVNGHAYGGGLELLLTCDFAYAVNTARFALPEVGLGIMPGAGGTQYLPRTVGERRAKEIMLTGRPFTAQQALDWGVVNEVCEPAELLPRVLETARAIASNAPIAVRQVKKAVRFGMQMELRTAFRFEVEAYNHLIDTEDRREGVAAFNEKRKAVFKGR